MTAPAPLASSWVRPKYSEATAVTRTVLPMTAGVVVLRR